MEVLLKVGWSTLRTMYRRVGNVYISINVHAKSIYSCDGNLWKTSFNTVEPWIVTNVMTNIDWYEKAKSTIVDFARTYRSPSIAKSTIFWCTDQYGENACWQKNYHKNQGRGGSRISARGGRPEIGGLMGWGWVVSMYAKTDFQHFTMLIAIM